jgi:hypothetical protein
VDLEIGDWWSSYDERRISLPCHCHRHIERFTRYARRHGDVAGIDGGALGAVDGDGVPQLYVFGNAVRI